MKREPTPPEEAKADALTRLADTGPGHIHCSQAVARFALLVQGYDPDLTTIGRYLGGGVVGMGEACGALTGAALSLGLRDFHMPGGAPELEPPTAERLQDIIRDFTQEFGNRTCRNLTGLDLSTPEGFEAFEKSDNPDRCAGYVGWMCDQLLPLLTPDAGAGASET